MQKTKAEISLKFTNLIQINKLMRLILTMHSLDTSNKTSGTNSTFLLLLKILLWRIEVTARHK